MFYTDIYANKEQTQALIERHLSKIKKTEFDYDDDDSVGFVTLITKTGKTIEYQCSKNGNPYYPVEFEGFGKDGNIRYIVLNEEYTEELHNILKKYAVEITKRFWSAADI